MTTRTQGDPKIYMLPNGIEIRYQGGQPIMDPSGLSNMILILLFTERGWPMNKVLPPEQRIGSDFIAETRKPINIDQIRQIEIAATDALQPIKKSGIGEIIDLSVRMASGNQIYLTFKIQPPGGSCENICLSGYGRTWQLQQEAA